MGCTKDLKATKEDTKAIICVNTKRNAGMKRRTATKEQAAAVQAATPSTSQDEESNVPDDSQH